MEKGNSSLESKPLLNTVYNADSPILTDQNLLSALNSDSTQGKALPQLFLLLWSKLPVNLNRRLVSSIIGRILFLSARYSHFWHRDECIVRACRFRSKCWNRRSRVELLWKNMPKYCYQFSTWILEVYYLFPNYEYHHIIPLQRLFVLSEFLPVPCLFFRRSLRTF